MFEVVWFLWVNQRGVEIIDILLPSVVWKVDVLKKKIEISERWFSDVYLTRVFKCWLCKIPVIYVRLVSIWKMYIIEQSILVQKIIADGCIVNVVIRYALNWFIGNIAYFCWKCWFSEICHNTIDLRNFLFSNYLSPHPTPSGTF